jgi:3-isopropylmalate dehydrogenase
MAQATHGSAPDIAGRGIANPYAMIMSGKMLFDWLAVKHAQPRAAQAAGFIEQAMEQVLARGRHLTRDLGGQAATEEMGDAVAAAI